MMIAPGVLMLLLIFALYAVLRPDQVDRAVSVHRDAIRSTARSVREALRNCLTSVRHALRSRFDGLARGRPDGGSVVHGVVGLTTLSSAGAAVLAGDALIGAAAVCGMLRSPCAVIQQRFDPALATWLAVLGATVLWAMILFDLFGFTKWVKWPQHTWFKFAVALLFGLSVFVLVAAGLFRKAMLSGDLAVARDWSDTFVVAGGVLVALTSPLAALTVIWVLELVLLALGFGVASLVVATAWVAVSVSGWGLGIVLTGLMHFVQVVRPPQTDLDSGNHSSLDRPRHRSVSWWAVASSTALALVAVSLILM